MHTFTRCVRLVNVCVSQDAHIYKMLFHLAVGKCYLEHDVMKAEGLTRQQPRSVLGSAVDVNLLSRTYVT
jgi:hypothetical protein